MIKRFVPFTLSPLPFALSFLCALLFAFCLPTAAAQQPAKIPRIGIVSGSGNANNPGPTVEALRQGLRDLGYIEGKNILLEYRYYEGISERNPSLVAELVQLKVDVLVSTQTPGIQAAKQATKTIPIVMVTTADPVAAGLIDSLARPGGNITGLTLLTRDLNGKRLELLKEIVPKVSRVGVLLTDSVQGRIRLEEYEAAARTLKMSLQSLEIRTQNPDFEGAFQTAIKERVNALITRRSGLLIVNRKRLADLAIKYRLPSMSERGDMVEAGALASYSANETESLKRAAWYVDKILKGAKPADLPVEQPTKFEFVINLKTAKALNLTVPQSVLYRADRVIK
jgi:putative tryptophan/tyrosine transport system substrate-binding protein